MRSVQSCLHEIGQRRHPVGQQRLGFAEHRSGLEWSRMINTTSQNQAGLIRALRGTDLRIKEIRFREPGLDTLFSKLTDGDVLP